MKILNELRKAKGFTSFLATTFSLDLPWFEALLLRQLNINGVKRFVIFADTEQLSQALNDEADNLRRAGRSYLLQGVRATRSFHPKVILLTGEKAARLYVGSGNLSKGGLQYNLEIFERWDFEIEDKNVPAEFLFARDYFYDIANTQTEYCAPILRRTLDQTFSLPVFTRPIDPSIPPSLLASPSALMDQIPKAEQCEKLRIVSPFFDENAQLVYEMVKRFNASSFQVITDTRKSNLTPSGAKRIEQLGGELLTLDPDKHSRALHAKMYYAEGSDWNWGAIGSANASIAAWHAHNAEVIATKEGPDAITIDNLMDELCTRPLSDADWKILEKAAQLRELASNKDDDDSVPPPRILFAEWVSLTRVKLNISPGNWDIKQIEFFGETPVIASTLSIETNDSGAIQALATYPQAPDRTKVNLLRLIGEEATGPWAVIHDSEELKAQASKTRPEREKLEELLGTEYFDPDAAQKMMELYARIMEERNKQKELNQGTPKNKAQADIINKDDNSSPEWRDVNLTDFSYGDTGEFDDHYERSGGGIILSTRLMNQLLYGDIDDKIQVVDSDGESESDEDQFGDDSNVQRLPNGPKNNKKKPVDTAKQGIFLAAATKAREEYVRDLTNADSERKSPYRLLEDLQILTAPLHYMFQGGGINANAFRAELVLVLRAFMGGNSAPFVMAIKGLEPEDLREFWESTPAFHLVQLIVYNACLADVGASFSTQEEDIQGFVKVLPVLWLRHVIRTVPNDLLSILEKKSAGMIPMLRCGSLWIANKLPALEGKFSFPAFISAMVRQTYLLDTLDLQFDNRFSPLRGKIDLELAEEEAFIVLGRRMIGSLGLGWVEDGQIFIHDGAFQKPKEENFYEQMPRVEKNQAMSVQLLEKSIETLEEDVIQGLELVKRINP